MRKADSLLPPDDLNSDLYLDARMLEARAAFGAEPATLPQISRQLDAYLSAHASNPASRDSSRAGFRRQKLVHALAYAAAGQSSMASSSLREAPAPQFRDGLDDSELREVALTIAIANGDKAAAGIALDGFDVANTQSGRVLALYAKWAAQSSGAAAASRAQARSSALGKQGRDLWYPPDSIRTIRSATWRRQLPAVTIDAFAQSVAGICLRRIAGLLQAWPVPTRITAS